MEQVGDFIVSRPERTRREIACPHDPSSLPSRSSHDSLIQSCSPPCPRALLRVCACGGGCQRFHRLSRGLEERVRRYFGELYRNTPLFDEEVRGLGSIQ